MGRGDPDPLPPIEIVGAAPAAESLQRVTTGPGGPRRTSGRAVAVAAGVVLLVLGGLALSDDGGGSGGSDGKEARDNSAKVPLKRTTTTTRPRPTTTRPPTTTTTRPVGPVFGAPLDAGLLVYGTTGWQLIDLDTGARTPLGLPGENAEGSVYEAVPVTGGLVLRASDGERVASFYGIGPDGEEREPVGLGPADQVLPGGRPDRVWLIDGGGRINEGGGFANPVVDVRLVETDGTVLRSFEIDATYVSEAVGAGLVVDRGGRVYLADESGFHAVAVGWTSGVIDDDLLVLSCDDVAECGVYRQPVDGGRAIRLYVPDDSDEPGVDAVSAPDGRIALLVYGAERQRLVLLGSDGRRLATIDDAGSFYGGAPRWLPDGRGLVSPAGTGVIWVHERDGEWVSEGVRSLSDLPAEVAYVIEW